MRRLLMLVALFCLFALPVQATVPQLLSHQGLLTDSGGTALTGSFDITVALYNVDTGGSALWTETHTGVVVTDGIYGILLGSNGSPLTLPFDVQYWLGVQVAPDSEMTPRIRLAAGAYALNAQQVLGASNNVPGAGSVSIGSATADPNIQLQVVNTGAAPTFKLNKTDAGGETNLWYEVNGSRVATIYDGQKISWWRNPNHLMVIENGGNVGIGTETPTRKLDVNGDVNFNGTIYNPYVATSGTGDTPSTGYGGLSAQGTNRSLYLTAGSGTVWIGRDGKVGVGTGAPSTALEVAGTATATAFVGDGSGLTNISGTADSDWLESGGNVYRLNGNVGIGSTTPFGSTLDIGSTSYANYADIGLRTDAHRYVIGVGHNAAAYGVPGKLYFWDETNSTMRMVMDSSGNFGFGTVSPLSRLHVNGDILVQDDSELTSNAIRHIGRDWDGPGPGSFHGMELGGLDSADEGYVAFHTHDKGGGAGERVRIDKSGNLLVGTTAASNPGFNSALVVDAGSGVRPVGLFEGDNHSAGDVNSYIFLRDKTGGVYWGFKAANNGDWGLHQAGVGDRIYVTTTGNVGIGTTSPTQKLHVNGTALADAHTTPSSRRWKKNIHTIDGALSTIQRLRGVTYDWKKTDKHDIGLIAEEVGAVIPEVVQYEENGIDAQSVDYARIVAVLIEAVKEQQIQIDDLQREVRTLSATQRNEDYALDNQ